MGRILALDVGDVRIGLAVSDLMGIIANPLETYVRKDFVKDIDYIVNLAKEMEVDTIVSGLPKNLNNQDSLQTQKVREFVDKLEEAWGKKVVFVDERFTTAYAQRVLLEGNVRRGDRKKVVDKVAATIILQTYLEIKK
jgi:putative Holliday junction resolvase